MTKRSGIEWLIWLFVILDILLLVGFIVLHVTDTRLVDNDIHHASIPIVNDVQAPEDAALRSGEAEMILGNSDASGRAAQSVLTVDGVQIDADLVVGSFRQRGGPDFSLYMDSNSFKLSENEGRCYVAASGNAGVKEYIELSYLPNCEAGSVASNLLSSYGAVVVNPAEKTECFGGFPALHVTGSSAETDLDSYTIAYNGGCVTIVLCTPGMPDDGTNSLRATLDSLIVHAS